MTIRQRSRMYRSDDESSGECELCNGAGSVPDAGVCPLCKGRGVEVNGVGFPKPESRKSEKRKERKYNAAWVTSVRHQVVLRDEGCRACREMGLSPEGRGGLPRMQMHENVYRSTTRGKPMSERVNTKNCILLCDQCHSDVHAKRLSIHISDGDLGADGKLRFKLWSRDEIQQEDLS